MKYSNRIVAVTILKKKRLMFWWKYQWNILKDWSKAGTHILHVKVKPLSSVVMMWSFKWMSILSCLYIRVYGYYLLFT